MKIKNIYYFNIFLNKIIVKNNYCPFNPEDRTGIRGHAAINIHISTE